MHWDGDVEQFAADSVDARAGGTDAQFGTNSLRFEDGRYRLELGLDRRPITASLSLTPLTHPAVASSVRLSGGGPMRWLVVPRLQATGEVTIDGRRYALDGCLAYHDRNWGHFAWGADFSWEWATVLPDDPAVPWTLVYMRIGDRRRSRTLSQGLIVWRGDNAGRTFVSRDLAVSLSGLLAVERPLRVPRIMHLVSPGLGADVPRQLAIEAATGADQLSCTLDFSGLSQIGIPTDVGRGISLLSETGGRARVTGRIGGRNVDFEGRALAEFHHACG